MIRRLGAERLTLAILLVLALAAALSTALAGAGAWPSVWVAGVLIAYGVGSRYGYWLGIAAAVIVTLLGVLLVLTLTGTLGLPMNQTVALAATGASVLAAALASRAAPALIQPLRAGRMLPLLAASSGSILTMGALAVSQRLPDNLRLDWVMRKDAANNLTFAREVIARGGISVGAGENPAPLPSALVGLTASPFHGNVSPQKLLEHDLSAMALTWAVVIAVTCLLTGLVAAAIVRRANGSERFVTGAALVGSLVVLSWAFSGYPMQFGFLNTHVALVVLLAAALAYLSSAPARWLAISLMLCGGILMLGTWSPLVVVPGGLTAAFLATSWPSLWASRGVRLAAIVTASILLVAYAIVITVPVLLAQREALGASGGVFNPGNWVIFVVGAATIALAAVVFSGIRRPEFAGIAGIVLFSWIGLGILLYASRDQPDPFTYYPVKFAWLALLVFLVIDLGLAVACVARLRTPSVLQTAAIVAVAGAAAVVIAWVPTWGERNQAQHPLAFIAVGNESSGFPTLDSYVLDYTGADAPAVLWNSGFAGESEANIWIMQVEAGSLDSELRLLPFESYDDKDPAYLCRAQELMGPGLEVHTADADLADSLEAVCPQSTATFVVEEPRGPGIG